MRGARSLRFERVGHRASRTYKRAMWTHTPSVLRRVDQEVALADDQVILGGVLPMIARARRPAGELPSRGHDYLAESLDIVYIALATVGGCALGRVTPYAAKVLLTQAKKDDTTSAKRQRGMAVDRAHLCVMLRCICLKACTRKRCACLMEASVCAIEPRTADSDLTWRVRKATSSRRPLTMHVHIMYVRVRESRGVSRHIAAWAVPARARRALVHL